MMDKMGTLDSQQQENSVFYITGRSKAITSEPMGIG